MNNIVLLMLIILSISANAAAYKCEVNGKSVYQATPCEDSSTQKEIKVIRPSDQEVVNAKVNMYKYEYQQEVAAVKQKEAARQQQFDNIQTNMQLLQQREYQLQQQVANDSRQALQEIKQQELERRYPAHPIHYYNYNYR